MLLRTLGGLDLEDHTFSQPQPLLLLSYICLEGKTSRHTLGELFWPDADSTNRSKSLHTALEKLLKEGLIRQTGTLLEANVVCDIEQFNECCLTQDEEALGIYRGLFLHGLETSKRLKLGKDLESWLLSKRDELHEQWLKLLLAFAERERDQNNLKTAAHFAWRAFKEAQQTGDETILRQIYGLLLDAGQQRKANQVREQAERDYGMTWQHPHLLERPKIFVGRQNERAELRRLLAPTKGCLLTLTGLGGVGKTELATVVANDLRYHYGRVAFVSLESLPDSTDETTFLAKIAAVFRLELPGRTSSEAVARELGYEPALLVLDNFEHLLHLKTCLSRLLEQCESLNVLVTSREQLLLVNETVVTLEGLDVPPNAEADFESYAAPQLLLALCRGKGADVSGQHQDVLEVCMMVAGLPLALHLAAAWASVLPLATLREKLAADLGVLDQSAKARHARLGGVLEASVSRLTPEESIALMALLVFEGKVSFASVNAVAGLSLRTLKRLVETSLLRFDTYGFENRAAPSYDLHPLLRQYLKENLDTSQQNELQEKHAVYYLGQLALTTNPDEALKAETRLRLHDEAADVFAAWRFEAHANIMRLFDLAFVLTDFCDDTAECSEGSLLLAQLVQENTDLHPAWCGRFLACRAWLELRLGNTETVKRLATEALALLPSEDAPSLSRCYIALAAISDDAGEFEVARDALEKELALYPPDSGEAANARINLALIHQQSGEFEKVEHYLTEAEAYYAPHQNTKRLLQIGFTRACVLSEQGDRLKARVLLERLLSQAREHHLHHRVTLLEMQLARVLYELGEIKRSRHLVSKLLGKHQDDLWLKAKMLLLLGDISLDEHEPRAALPCYLQALKGVIPTRSIPAILLRLARLAKVAFIAGENTLATRLAAYCAEANNYRRTSFVDRAFVDELLREYIHLIRDDQLLAQEWLVLEAEDIAVLAVSEVEFVLANSFNQDGLEPTLIAEKT